MQIEVVTQQDLQRFQQELLQQISELMGQNDSQKKWLRSAEVREMLGGISDGTLQKLRINGTIPYTKLGGITYYPKEEIERQLLDNIQNGDLRWGTNEKQINYFWPLL